MEKENIPKYKTVLKPLTIPAGDYCWESKPPYAICDYFDNDGGYPVCYMRHGELKYNIDGSVSKPRECLALKEK